MTKETRSEVLFLEVAESNPGAKRLYEWLQEDEETSLSLCQRPYEWSDTLVTAFLTDILDATKVNPDIGLVTIERDGNGIKILDGQQRLLTFALFLHELGEEKGTRLKRLLEQPAASLASVRRAQEVRKLMREFIATRSVGMQKVHELLLECLKKVTFGIVELSSQKPADVLRQFLETNGCKEPLNGGQILRAYHFGKLRTDQCGNDGKGPDFRTLQKRLYDWCRHPESDPKIEGLSGFPLKRILPQEGDLSFEQFVDSPGQKVWWELGPGFVQALQAVLLRQDLWWFEIAEQGRERLHPYDRLEGKRSGGRRRSFSPYHAVTDLFFAPGLDFFRFVHRFGHLYADYAEHWTTLLEHKTIEEHEDTPGALVVRAVSMVNRFAVRVFESLERNRSQLSPQEREVGKKGTGRVFGSRDEWCTVESWIGKRTSDRMETSRGPGTLAWFALALHWCDRFGTETDRSDGFSKSLDEETRRAILILLLYEIFATRWVGSFKSFLSGMRIREAVEAADVSQDAQSALWRFFREAAVPWWVFSWKETFQEVLFSMKHPEEQEDRLLLEELFARWIKEA